MRAGLLLCAVCWAQSAAAAARHGLLPRRGQRLYSSLNSTWGSLPIPDPALEDAQSAISPSPSSSLPPVRQSATALAEASPGHEFSGLSGDNLPSTPPSSNLPYPTSTAHGNSTGDATQSLKPLESSSGAGPPSTQLALPSAEATVTVTVDCPSGAETGNCTATPITDAAGTYSEAVPTSTNDCTSIPDDRPITHFSVVYTSTVTLFAHNSSAYTPPFESLTIPNFCMPTNARALAPPAAVPGFESPEPLSHTTAVDAKPAARKGIDRHASRPSFTFITTDKNPAVVFPSKPPPRHSPTQALPGDDHADGDHKPASFRGDGGDMHIKSADHLNPANIPPSRIANHGSGHHKPAAGAGDGIGVGKKTAGQAGHAFSPPDAASAERDTPTNFRITARADRITINEKTFSDLKPDETSVVTAHGAFFTILPNAVVGVGATVSKPVPAGTVVSIATPTADVVGGLRVTLKDSEAVVGDATLTMAEERITTTVDSQLVTLGPGTLAVGQQTLSFEPVMPRREKEMLVKGGELLTAIGKNIVVIHSTTFTYGLGVPETTKIVNGETISIGPSGISVHGLVAGGSLADATDTRYEVVGGATVTRIAPSLAIINGATFTIGPGTRWTTTVVAGETLTIGPTGVIMSDVTLKYPFGLAVTATVMPTGTYSEDLPAETAGKHNKVDSSMADLDDEDSEGCLTAPLFRSGWVAFSIASGILLWV